MKKRKARILVSFLAVLLVSVSACKNPFLKKMLVEEEKGKTVPEKPHAPFVEGGASLILSPDKLDITVEITTADSTPITVEGCTETELTSGMYTVLHAKGRRVILKGNITKLECRGNQLTALNVQGLTALQGLYCDNNQLTALNVQGLTALESLGCDNNRLTAFNVQGLTALKYLFCYSNQLTALDVQGLTALERLHCYNNKLTALNVQGLTALKELYCYNNQLTALNVQGLTALQGLHCYNNKLTALNVQGLTALGWLYCGNNQLTTLNVQGLTALRTLRCYNNKLTAQAFTKLFDDLPTRQDSDKGECILYTEESGVTESNHTDFTAPQDLKDAFDNAKTVKKWKMYKWNGSWPGVEI